MYGGKFGGNFIPETLKKPIDDLTKLFTKLRNDKLFLRERDHYFVNYKLVEEVWKSVFKNKFYSIEYNPDDNLKIFKDFINIIGTKDISNYKIPEKVNVRGKISPWKLKRIFNFIYLKFNTKKYFNLI